MPAAGLKLRSPRRPAQIAARALGHPLWIATACLLAQASLQAAEISVTSNQLPVQLGPYLDHYEDRDGSLNLESVLAQDLPWRRSGQSTPTLGLSDSTHWFKVELRGRQLEERALLLVLQDATLDRVGYGIVRSGQVAERGVLGDTVPLAEIDLPYRFPLLQFVMPEDGGPVSIYLQVISRGGIELPLTLTTFAKFNAGQQGQLTFFGALLAFFFIGFCVCALLYYNFRDRSFLGYTLFFGGTIPFFLAQTGIGRVWLWGDYGDANNRIALVTATLLIVSICQLGLSLSLDFRYRDSVNIVLRFLSWLMLPTALYFLLMPVTDISSGNISTLMLTGLLAALVVCVMAAISAAQGSRVALYLFLSWALIIVSYSSMLIYKFLPVERSDASSVLAEALAIAAGVMLLLSIAELVRGKNEELATVRRETRAKGDFLRNVSREFLTPVHLILANAKRLGAAQSSPLDEPARQHMDTVIRQSDHLHKLINDLLEMAEIESESFEPEFELVEMSRFLSELRDMMLPAALERGLELHTDFASANLLVQTDRARLQHALINIITNAIKFTETGSVTLGYKAVYFRRRLGIEISVRDTGRGMSESFMESLFEEFAREEPESESNPQGTGLSLVIVKRMLERLGGEISVSSTRGIGSQFFVRLPLRVATD